ncbi:recombinase family protein, partial [Mesorhizobium sp. ZMM04-5]
MFDQADASFVSVTQQFNTTTSMGRLTLNVLLSFAQFEREVTAERIRDKIAASKKKGMWMGGVVPLGYRVENRKLLVHADEAKTVRWLFKTYLELKSVRALVDKAASHGHFGRKSIRKDGSTVLTRPFGRGNLYHLLSNVIYVGSIRHRDRIYNGEHDA